MCILTDLLNITLEYKDTNPQLQLDFILFLRSSDQNKPTVNNRRARECPPVTVMQFGKNVFINWKSDKLVVYFKGA